MYLSIIYDLTINIISELFGAFVLGIIFYLLIKRWENSLVNPVRLRLQKKIRNICVDIFSHVPGIYKESGNYEKNRAKSKLMNRSLDGMKSKRKELLSILELGDERTLSNELISKILDLEEELNLFLNYISNYPDYKQMKLDIILLLLKDIFKICNDEDMVFCMEVFINSICENKRALS